MYKRLYDFLIMSINLDFVKIILQLWLSLMLLMTSTIVLIIMKLYLVSIR